MERLKFSILFIFVLFLSIYAKTERTITFHHECLKTSQALSDTLNKKTIYFQKDPFLTINDPHFITKAGLSSAGTGWFQESYFLELTKKQVDKINQNNRGIIKKRIIVAIDGKPFFIKRFNTMPGEIEIRQNQLNKFKR